MKKLENSTFSVELKTITKVLIDQEKGSLIEGSLGRVTEVLVHDAVLLEVIGTEGVLRLDIPVANIKSAIKEA